MKAGIMQECGPLPLQCAVFISMIRDLGEERGQVRQDAETTLSIVRSVIQSVGLEITRLVAPLSFKRNSLSPWCINSACALFPTAALLQSKEVGLLSIQIFSFVPMFSRLGRFRRVRVCFTVCLWDCAHMWAGGCVSKRVHSRGHSVRLGVYLYVSNHVGKVLYPLIVCVCLWSLIDTVKLYLRYEVPLQVADILVFFFHGNNVDILNYLVWYIYFWCPGQYPWSQCFLHCPESHLIYHWHPFILWISHWKRIS